MLEACNEAVSGNFLNYSTLVVNPLNALTDLEGVGQTVLRDGVGLCQSRNLVVLCIVLHQTVVGVNDSLGVSSLGGCNCVPGLGIGGVTQSISISNGHALAGQVILSPSEVLSSGGAGAPLSLHLVTDGGSQRILVHDDGSVVSVRIVAPEDRGNGVRSYAGDRVVTTVCGGGQHNAGLEQLCLGDSHQGKSLRHIGCSLSCGVVLVEVAEHLCIQLVRDSCMILACIRITGILEFLGGSGSTTCEGGNHHNQREHQAQKFLAHFVYVPFFFRPRSWIARTSTCSRPPHPQVAILQTAVCVL